MSIGAGDRSVVEGGASIEDSLVAGGGSVDEMFIG